MKSKIPEYIQKIDCSINSLANEVFCLVQDLTSAHVEYRIKDEKKLAKKLHLKKSNNVFTVHDVYGIRLLFESKEDVYKALVAVQSSFSGFVGHDYIQRPKIRKEEPLKGGKLRLIQFIAYKNNVPFEIQLTTHDFHKENETMHSYYEKKKYK